MNSTVRSRTLYEYLVLDLVPIPVLGKPAYHVVSRLTKECGRAPNFLAASSVAFSYHFLFEALVDITRQHYSHSPVVAGGVSCV